MREALEAQPLVSVEEIDLDHYLPSYRSIVMRAANRVLRPLQSAELGRDIQHVVRRQVPDVLIVYKGYGVGRNILDHVKAAGVLVVNVFPDHSPHAYGRALRDAVGVCDLVISTKPFHPQGWRGIYGYSNPCVFVPHGYDPALHYWPHPPICYAFDVVLAATWRPEYHMLMRDFADVVSGLPLQVAIAGHGWQLHHADLPSSWHLIGAVTGRGYGEFLRSGRIAIAPVHRGATTGGGAQPGDEDTTRTYELAASHCFMLHQRTAYVATVFDPRLEVPLWDDATELAALVRHYLPRDAERHTMAAATHARAVPQYSALNRAAQVIDHIRRALSTRKEGAAKVNRIDAT
jgi:hypothetical protein